MDALVIQTAKVVLVGLTLPDLLPLTLEGKSVEEQV